MTPRPELSDVLASLGEWAAARKAVLAGVALALALGCGLGAVLRSNVRDALQSQNQPMAPAPEGAEPTVRYSSVYETRSGPTPDYVIGTDWLPKPDDPRLNAVEPEPEARDEALAAAPAVPPIPSPAPAPPRPPAPDIDYPSMTGDITAGATRPPATPEPDAPPQPPPA